LAGGDHALLACGVVRRTWMRSLALPIGQAEDLDGLAACGSEPVWKPGAGLSGFAGSRRCLLTLRLWLSARLVCYFREATESPMAGRARLGGLAARGSQSPEMPEGYVPVISAAVGTELVLNLSRWTCPSRTVARRRWR
jgi:hypothetical protein